MFPVQLQIDATFEALEKAVPTLRDEAAEILPQEQLDAFEIALVEALNNIVRHAYANRDDGRIEITMATRQRALIVVLGDDGIAADATRFQPERPGDLSDAVDDLQESGWGLDLIRRCSDGMSYRALPSGNELTLTFRT